MLKTFNIDDMQTYFRAYVPCHLHKTQPITNFCTDPKCNIYLCPQCVQDHSKINFNHQVESIKTCITKTKKRLEDTIKQLESQNERYNLISLENGEQIIKKFLKQLQSSKSKLILQIEAYFKQKQNQVRKQTAKYSKIHGNLDILKKQLHQAIKQLKIFKKHLFETSKTVEVIQKANKIDYNLMIEHFKKKNKRIQKDMKINFRIQENKQKKQQLRVTLKDLIEIKSKEENKNRKREEFKDSLALQNEGFFQSRSRQIKKEFIVNAPPLSADRYFSKSSFLIEHQNYFKSGQPFLHFFQVSKANLHIVKIRELQQNFPLKWQIIPLEVNFNISSFHKTIATEVGVIYLIGGTEEETMKKNPFVYQYIPQTRALKAVCRLNNPRSSHSVTCNKGLIYIIGGIGDIDAVRQCEVFNSSLSICQSLASCKYPTINSCVSYLLSANSLVKLGGIFASGQNNDHVQIYSISNNQWIQIDPIIDNLKGEFQLLSCSGWSPLNQNQIFIYGGYNEQKDNESSGLSYIIEYNTQLNEYAIKHINVKNLPGEQGFWSQQGVVHNNVIYGLENIDGEEGGDCLQDQRMVVIFDGKYWKTF